jgi:hypothetical protein
MQSRRSLQASFPLARPSEHQNRPCLASVRQEIPGQTRTPQRVQVGSPASQAKLEHVPFTSARNVEVNATSSNSEHAHADNDIDIGVPSLQVIDGDLLFSYSLD